MEGRQSRNERDLVSAQEKNLLRRTRLRAKILFTVLTTLGFLLSLETGFRLAKGPLGVQKADLHRIRSLDLRGSPPEYQPRPYTTYGLKAHGWQTRRGYLGEEIPLSKAPGRLRIACLGASTTKSGNRKGYLGSYPYFLKEILEREIGAQVEIMSWGVPGWTTAETLVNYVISAQDYEPDIVILHHAVNDLEPRYWPDYRTDFFHYRRSWRFTNRPLILRWLVRHSDLFAYLRFKQIRAWDIRDFVTHNRRAHLRNLDTTLRPGTDAGFVRNVRTLCDLVKLREGIPILATMPFDQARSEDFPGLILGIEEHNQLLRKHASSAQVLLVDLEKVFRERVEELSTHFLDLCHVEPEGNRAKAQAIADFLGAARLLPMDHED